ncbi:helix-turn-helix domain-containing protein [Pseudomonas aeruginosa]|uniref:helix-turn-helix domain-containing protein n=1 Tax=Pseudomonas aeruginosa TaxID=287 RepID=UPI003AE96626
MSSPAPTEIRAAREVAGLSQTAAAELVHSKLRTWQQWEAGDRRMHPGLWELFRLKTATLTAA